MAQTTAWREHLTLFNKALKENKDYWVNGTYVRGRVKSKPNRFGNRSLDLVADWNSEEDVTTRRLKVEIKTNDLNGSFSKALLEAKELILQANMGLSTRRLTYDDKAIRPKQLRQIQAAQLLKAKKYLAARSERLNNNDRTLADHIRWTEHVFGYSKQEGREISLQLWAEATAVLYPWRGQASYKRSLEIGKNVCRELKVPLGIQEEDKPAYKQNTSNLLSTPSEAEVRERLEAIQDADEQKLAFAITSTGLRHMDIYSVDWNTYLPKTGRARYWCSKKQKQYVMVPCAIDGFWLDLSGWRPPEYETYHLWGEKADPNLERIKFLQSHKLSKWYSHVMGFSSTTNRHRYCSFTISSGFHSIESCARAVGTSASQIDATYGNESCEYDYHLGLAAEKA